jgi:hypothetical protein
MLVDTNRWLSGWGRTEISTDKAPPPAFYRKLRLMRKLPASDQSFLNLGESHQSNASGFNMDGKRKTQ